MLPSTITLPCARSLAHHLACPPGRLQSHSQLAVLRERLAPQHRYYRRRRHSGPPFGAHAARCLDVRAPHFALRGRASLRCAWRTGCWWSGGWSRGRARRPRLSSPRAAARFRPRRSPWRRTQPVSPLPVRMRAERAQRRADTACPRNRSQLPRIARGARASASRLGLLRAGQDHCHHGPEVTTARSCPPPPPRGEPRVSHEEWCPQWLRQVDPAGSSLQTALRGLVRARQAPARVRLADDGCRQF